MKIKLHSTTDLITNSSTVIYTWSENSLKVCEDLINEMLQVFGIVDKTCDDLFNLSVGMQGNDYYRDYLSEMDKEEIPEELKNYNDLGYFEGGELLNSYIKKVNNGEIKKPGWMCVVEEGDGDSPRPSTILTVVPKDPKYEKLAEKIVNFLYSTQQYVGFNG
jgi:hypothetical protein